MPRDRKPTEAENAGRLARKAARQIQQRGWTRYKLVDRETGNVCLLGAALLASGARVDHEVTGREAVPVISFARHFAQWLGGGCPDWTARSIVSSWNDGNISGHFKLDLAFASPETQQDLLDVLAKFSAELDPRGESDASRNPAALR